MKKSLLVMTLLVLSLFICTGANAIDVFIDGVKVPFDNNTGYPFIENGRTLVPLRATMEAFGAEVKWDAEQRTAVVIKDTTAVTCKIDEMCVFRNNVLIGNDAAAVIRNSRTYLPIRVVLESFGASVSWDGNVNVISGAGGKLINDIENSGIKVSNVWKHWNSALSKKKSGDYNGAIAAFRQLAPTFLNASDSSSDAMLYKHLGECYSSLGMDSEASACFKRESEYWSLVPSQSETAIDARRRSTLTKPTVQLYAKTLQPQSYMKTYFGQKFEPQTGIYLGAYAEGDSAVHDPYSPSLFYADAFPNLVGKDMAGYLLYLTHGTQLSNYNSHISRLKEKNKILQVAVEPSNIHSITVNDSYYVEMARQMEASGLRYLVRFAGEMNELSCPWYIAPENASIYIEKFRIVADIFHTYAPTSAAMVWSPNFYPENTIEKYYPGDAYVDYVGISAYKHQQTETDPLKQGVDRSRFSSLLDYIFTHYGYKKPIIISEGGASYINQDTRADITGFASQQLYDFYAYLPIKYPAVKAAFIFGTDDANYKFTLSRNATYLDAYKRGISSNAYLTQPETQTGFGYYELGHNVPVAAGYTELSSFVKTLRNDISYVVYRVNGADVATAYGVPYTVTADLSAYRGKQVPVSVLAFSSTGAKVAEETFNIYVH